MAAPIKSASKYIVGVLDDALKKGDQEALEYYNVPAKHWTATNWDEVDMSKVDVGLHSDPSEAGFQAADRREFYEISGRLSLGDDVTKDLRLHVGNDLSVDFDPGSWDSPAIAYEAIQSALDERSVALSDAFQDRFSDYVYLGGSTIEGNPGAIRAMSKMREWLLDHDIDTITYKNEQEGLDTATDAALSSPEWLEYEAKQLEEVRNAWNSGNDELAIRLEDELEFEKESIREQVANDNISYISLDPGNVRDARAEFSKDAIGKPGMMLSGAGAAVGAGLVGGQSQEADASPLSGLAKAGFHYSKNKNPMRRLDPSAYGTGAKGQEAGRLKGQDDIAPRTFFYEEGTRPRPGFSVPSPESVVGGGPLYRGALTNVYDLNENPLGFTGSANEIERKVKDAGFSGYSRDGVSVQFDETPVERLGISMFEGNQELARRAALGDNANMVTAELIPSAQTDFGRLMLKQPLETREQYTDQLFDMISRAPGLRGVSATQGYGAYEGAINPNYIFRTETPEQAKTVADIVGGATRQDAVPYVSRDGDGPLGVRISTDGAFTDQDVTTLLDKYGIDSTRTSLGEIDAINFGDMNEEEFMGLIQQAFPSAKTSTYRAGGDYNDTSALWESGDTKNLRSEVDRFNERFAKALGIGGAAVGTGLIAGQSQQAEAGIIKPSMLLDIPSSVMADDYIPKNTQSAYKLFRTDGENLFPLFVDSKTPVPVGEWQKAIVGDQAKSGKVKSKIGELAYRPGWHAGDNAAATHIGGKSSSGLKAPDIRPNNQVWAEVLMADDLPWQEAANAQAQYTKSGNPIARTQHITDGVPYGGHYRYKTNPNMTGEWLIGGDMRVNRVLSDEEVADINASRGYADLPRAEQSRLLDQALERFGSAPITNMASEALQGPSVRRAMMEGVKAGGRDYLREEDAYGSIEGRSSVRADVQNYIDEGLRSLGLNESGRLDDSVMTALDYSPAAAATSAIDAYDALQNEEYGNAVGFGALAMLDSIPLVNPLRRAISGGADALIGMVNPQTAVRGRQALDGVEYFEPPADFVENASRVAQEEYLTSKKGIQPPATMQGRLGPIAGAILEDGKRGGFLLEHSNRVDTQRLPVLSADDLSGSAVVPIKGDATADALMTRYYGAALDEPVALDAGIGFAVRNNQGENPMAWASTEGIAQRFADKVSSVADHAGTDKVIGLNRRMSDMTSADFNTMPLTTANSLLRQYGHLDKPLISQLDKAGSSIDPAFPGFMSDELPAYLSHISAGKRKKLLNLFDGDAPGSMRERAIGRSDLIRSVIDFDLINDPVRTNGRLAVQLDTSGKIQRGANHNTYDAGILAKKDGVMGRLDYPASTDDLYGELYRDLLKQYTDPKKTARNQNPNPPRLLNDEEAANALSDSNPGSIRTDGYMLMTDERIQRLIDLGLIRP